MKESAEEKSDKLSVWGRGVVALLLLSFIGGAISTIANGETSGGGIIADLIKGVFFGWFAFATGVVAYAFGGIFVALLSLLIWQYDKPTRLLKFLKWSSLLVGFCFTSWYVVSSTYQGIYSNRLVPARTHYEKCMQPTTRVERTYPQSLCADGWISPSSGKGRCSSHGGVRREPIERTVTYQPYTAAQCSKRAHATSWID